MKNLQNHETMKNYKIKKEKNRPYKAWWHTPVKRSFRGCCEL